MLYFGYFSTAWHENAICKGFRKEKQVKVKLNLIDGPQARILKPSQDLKAIVLFPKTANAGTYTHSKLYNISWFLKYIYVF